MSNKSMSRRDCLKASALLLGTVPFAGTLFANAAKESAKEPAKESAVPIYDDNMLVTNLKLPQVKQFNYVDDAKSLKEKAPNAPTKIAAAEQFCYNCALYQEPGYLKGTKTEAGKCPMFANKVVKGEAWCKLWVQGPVKRPPAAAK